MRGTEILLDRPRRLRFDFNAIADFDTEGPTGFARIMSERTFAGIRLALFHGLKHEDRTLTLEKTGNIIQRYVDQFEGVDSPLSYLSEKISVALQESGLLKAPPAEGNLEEPTTSTASASSVPVESA